MHEFGSITSVEQVPAGLPVYGGKSLPSPSRFGRLLAWLVVLLGCAVFLTNAVLILGGRWDGDEYSIFGLFRQHGLQYPGFSHAALEPAAGLRNCAVFVLPGGAMDACAADCAVPCAAVGGIAVWCGGHDVAPGACRIALPAESGTPVHWRCSCSVTQSTTCFSGRRPRHIHWRWQVCWSRRSRSSTAAPPGIAAA